MLSLSDACDYTGRAGAENLRVDRDAASVL